jgi:carboxymethylenebutenolidase
MGQTIKLKAKDGFELGAYRADPAGTPKGGVVVIQEIFGVNHHIKNIADQYAKEGYVCIAPQMFDRGERNVELGYGEEDRGRGVALRQKLTWDTILADVAAARDALKGVGKVGIIGYCFGGSVVWKACCDLDGFSAGVGFYGGQVAEFKDLKPKCPVQLHFGELDQSIPMDKVDAIKAAHPEVPTFVYKGAGHGFTCDERGSFHEEAAKTAKARALEFLGSNLTPPKRAAA